MATAAVLHGKNNRLKVSAKAAPKVTSLKAVPKPTAKSTITRHKFEGDTIKVIGDKIPVREGSRRAEIFALFKNDMRLNEFLLAARKIRGGVPDVQIALDKKYIELV
tara:strand:+ start:1195 stop:1515 length:321 start_codon:yes stop_codon:yes gene_type:complete